MILYNPVVHLHIPVYSIHSMLKLSLIRKCITDWKHILAISINVQKILESFCTDLCITNIFLYTLYIKIKFNSD